jgi:Transglycosylase-like domain
MRRRTKFGAGGLIALGALGLAALPGLGASGSPSHVVRPAAASDFRTHPLLWAGQVAAYDNYLTTLGFYQALMNAAAAQAVPRRGGGGGARCQDGPLEYGSGSYAIPAEIVQRESGGWYYSCNESTGACGAYQVIPSTWDGYGGYASACDAPPSVQDQWAAEAYAASGTSPWGG